jgi:uncharacterized protein YbjQ (UPF0145 family)
MMSGPEHYSLPSTAQGRLHHSTQSGAAATSFLGYSDFIQLDQMGFEPIAAVIGLSVVHLGRIQFAGVKQAIELEGYSQGIGLGALSAIGRLQDEAAMVGADGVLLNTVVTERRFDAEEHEYSIQGTALRFRPQPGALRTPSGRPFVFANSVQVLYQMLKRDHVPVAYGFGVCVYHVPHRSMRQALSQTFQNTEVPQFTDAWYTAREIALSRLQSQLEQNGASVVLHMSVDERAEAFGEHTAEFRAHGSGWVKREGVGKLIPTLDLVPGALVDKGLYVTQSNPGA